MSLASIPSAYRICLLGATVLLGATLAGCGGSSGDDDPLGEPAPTDDGGAIPTPGDPGSSTSVPGEGVAGLSLAGTLWWFDESNARAIRVPAETATLGSSATPFDLFAPDSWSNLAVLSTQTSLTPLPFSDERFVIVRQRCGDGSLFDPIDCVDVENESGALLSRFEVDTLVSRYSTRLSPDGTLIALFRHDDDILSPTSLEIYSIDGQLLARDQGLRRRHMAWTSDNRLVFLSVEGDRFFFTEPASTELLGQSAPDVSGTITSWSIAPDGQRLVFSLLRPAEGGERLGVSEIWTMDFGDFSDIRFRRVASSSGAADAQRGNWLSGRWSPDGRRVLVRHTNNSSLLDGVGGAAGGSSTGQGVFSNYYAMPPVEGTTLTLTATDARPAELVPLIRPFSARPSDRDRTTNWKPVDDLYWFD